MTGLHLTNNGSLRAAILGANDGLVSNFILVMGVAGGSDNPQFVLLSGIAAVSYTHLTLPTIYSV